MDSIELVNMQLESRPIVMMFDSQCCRWSVEMRLTISPENNVRLIKVIWERHPCTACSTRDISELVFDLLVFTDWTFVYCICWQDNTDDRRLFKWTRLFMTMQADATVDLCFFVVQGGKKWLINEIRRRISNQPNDVDFAFIHTNLIKVMRNCQAKRKQLQLDSFYFFF
jgi:hypothetical protein